MRSCSFVFPFAGFVKEIAPWMFEAAKSLGTIDDSGPSCTPTSDIVKQAGGAITQAAWQAVYFSDER
jgi:hypothetical protein